MQLKKFQNLFCGFGIFSEIVRVTLFSGHTVLCNLHTIYTTYYPIEHHYRVTQNKLNTGACLSKQ